MNSREFLSVFDREQRIEIEFPGVRKESSAHIVRFVRNAPGMNFILYSRLDESNVDRVIEEQIAYFTQMDQPFEWKVYAHDIPADLKDRLLAHGFESEDPESVMILELSKAAPTLLEPIRADVRQVTHQDQLEDVIEVEEQVWGEDFGWIRDRLGRDLDIPGYLSVYAAYVEGIPACSGWIYFHPKSQFATLWGGSTVPEFRNRGLYSAVLATRTQAAIQRGFRFLAIDASAMSRPIVERHACKWKDHRS